MKKICKTGLKVQSLLFDKKYFNTTKAKEWAKSHGYYYSMPDVKENTIRIRQEEPNKFDKDIFRTISFTKGIKAVVACPKKSFENGGFMDGYDFKNYEDLIEDFKKQKNKEQEIKISSDAFFKEEVTNEIGELISTLKERLEDLENDYINEGKLAIEHGELYYDYDLDDAIKKVSKSISYGLSERQIDEIKKEFDDDYISHLISFRESDYFEFLEFDEFEELGLYEDDYDYVTAKDGSRVKRYKSHIQEGYYFILIYHNVFESMLNDLYNVVGNYFYFNKQENKWVLADEDNDIFEIIEENIDFIKEMNNKINFYYYVLPKMQDYFKYLKNLEEEEGLNSDLEDRINEFIEEKDKSGWEYQEEFIQYIEDIVKENYGKESREQVVEDTIDHFDITQEIDILFIRNNVYEQFKKIDDKTGKFDFKNGGISKKQYEMGGNIKSSKYSVSNTNVNDACITEIIYLINSEKKIYDWFIDDYNKNLVIIFKDGLLIDDISKINRILEKFEICHDIIYPETNLHYDKEQRIITIMLKTDDFSVGEYEDGGVAGDEFEIRNILNEIPEVTDENKEIIINDFVKSGYSNLKSLFEETPETLSIKLKISATAKKLRQNIEGLGHYYAQLISTKMYENSGELTKKEVLEEVEEKVEDKIQETQQEEIQVGLESKMNDTWREEFERAKKENDLQALDVLYNKVKVALNGVAQSKGESTVKDFEALKKEIEDYAEILKKQNKEQKITNLALKIETLKDLAEFGVMKAKIQYETLIDIFELQAGITYEQYVNNKKFKNGGVLVGGKADKITEFDLAKKYNLKVGEINSRLQKGMLVEAEHTKDKKMQKEIALDHLSEFIDYYDRLEVMEKQAKTKKHISFGKSINKKQTESIKKYMLSNFSEGDFDVNDLGIIFFVDISESQYKKVKNYINNNLI